MELIRLFPLLRSQAMITGINLDLRKAVISSRRLEKPVHSFEILIDAKVNTNTRSLKTVRIFIVIKQTEKPLLTPNLRISLQLIIRPFLHYPYSMDSSEVIFREESEDQHSGQPVLHRSSNNSILQGYTGFNRVRFTILCNVHR